MEERFYLKMNLWTCSLEPSPLERDVFKRWRKGCRNGAMGHNIAGATGKPIRAVASYLTARGIPPRKLPPDMMRELTRLMADEPRPESEQTPLPDWSTSGMRDIQKERRHDMLTFEMYLAAWVAREGICDTPRKRKRKPAGSRQGA